MLLGVDVGTTGTKAVLTTEDGAILHTSYQGYPLISPSSSHVEQDSNVWWQAVTDTVRNCAAQLPTNERITALCLSVQGGTLVPADRQGRPVANAISWLDTRAVKEHADLIAEKGELFFYQKTGWRLSNCYNFVQILHMRRQSPELFAKTAYFLTVADYLHWRLTGWMVTDANSTGNSQLCNVATGDWDDDILALAQIDRSQLAEMVPTGVVIGTLTKAAAQALSLDTKVLVVSGAQDQYCSAISIGAFHPGDVMFSTGTSWVLLGVAQKMIYDTKHYLTIGRSILPGLYSGFAYTPAGGAAMQWYHDNMGRPSAIGASIESFDEITARASKISPGADGLFFFPHFAGTLFPTWRPKAKGLLCGLDFIHTQDHIARAMMEGIAFELLWMARAMQDVGYDFQVMHCLGGSTRSDVWMQMVCDMTGLEMKISTHADMAPLGAAMIAAVGSGVYTSYQEAFAQSYCRQRTLTPNAAMHREYASLFEQYRSLFQKQQDMIS